MDGSNNHTSHVKTPNEKTSTFSLYVIPKGINEANDEKGRFVTNKATLELRRPSCRSTFPLKRQEATRSTATPPRRDAGS